MPARVMTLKNLLDKKHKTFSFDGVWLDTMGTPERHGAWLIYGNEKHGKTWFALKLAGYLSRFARVLYVSGEEGTGRDFTNSCLRAGLTHRETPGFLDYESIAELDERLNKPRAHRIVLLDNLLIYNTELRNGRLHHLIKAHPDVLFIFLGHEERKEPYPASAKLARKLAKVIVRVEGLACAVSGRCPGGVLMIDEEKAELYHGHQIKAKK